MQQPESRSSKRPDDAALSFKEKYLRLRERFDRVSATQRQYTNDLRAARLKARRLKEENNHLLDLLSDIQQMTGSGPSTDSDTSMDDVDTTDNSDTEMASVKNEKRPAEKTPDLLQARSPSKSRSMEKSRKDTPSRPWNQLSPESVVGTVTSNNSSQANSPPRSVAPKTIITKDNIDSLIHDISANNARNKGLNEGAPQEGATIVSTGVMGTFTATSAQTANKQGGMEGEPPRKQTRRATKRADRGRPRVVVPLKTNPDGSLNYPIIVGKGTNEVIIENMGKIVWNGRGYHNHRYIFPVGFRSKKQYTSLSDTSKKTYFISEILDGGDYPIFQITLEDMPDKVFRHTSSSGAWELALKGLIELGYNAKTHASGPDMYGLTNLGVIKHIQEMPNANRCRRYMPLKWIIDDEHTEGDLLANQLGDTGTIGVKSPGRKKKINNSIYASNHEVLMSSLKEEAAAKASASKTVAQVTLEVGEGESSPKAKLPPTPRKYTKRKSSFSPGAPTTATATAAAVATTATTATSLEEMAGCEPMEGVILGNNPTDRKSSSMAPLPLLPSLNEYEQDSRSMFEPRESDHAAKGTRSVTLQPPSYGRSQLEP